MWNFQKTKTKRQCCADYIGSDSIVATHNCEYCEYPSVKDTDTQVLANQSSGRLLPSLQSATPIQTKRSDEGVKNRTENSLF